MKKNKSKYGSGEIVYSTNPDYQFIPSIAIPGFANTDLAEMSLRIWLDRKNRAGKEATIIKGYTGSAEDLEALGKELKSKCGVGGAVKDNEIILQGDHRQKVLNILLDKGYRQTKLAGG